MWASGLPMAVLAVHPGASWLARASGPAAWAEPASVRKDARRTPARSAPRESPPAHSAAEGSSCPFCNDNIPAVADQPADFPPPLTRLTEDEQIFRDSVREFAA